MDYLKEYKDAKEWHKKVCMMNLFHMNQLINHNRHWTLGDTARAFNVSIGLVSENLKLAKQLDVRPELLKAESRQQALNMERRKYTRINHVKHEDEDEDEY